MRIAQVAPPWLPVPPDGYGGVERVVASLTEGLVDGGHEVTLFASVGSKTRARLVSPLERGPIPDDPSAVADDMFHTMSAYLSADQFDIIHDHTRSRIGPALGAVADGSPPVVHTLHLPWSAINRRFFEQLYDRIHIVASSKTQAALNPGIRYAATIYDGIDVNEYPLCDEKEDYLIFVGRCAAEKGLDVALDVARRCDMPLMMVLKRRASAAEQRYFEQQVQPRLRPCDQVIEEPPHAEKVRLLQRARATLFPIQWDEPFGLVMPESMACGTPVVAMRRGSATELIVDGSTGFLCDTPEQMVTAVGLASNLSPVECRRHISRSFSTAMMVANYERLYASLAAG